MLQPTQLPALVLYSPMQKKYSQLVTSITKENLIDFENAFAGQSTVRISVNEFEGEFDWKDVDCPSLKLEEDEGFMDEELEAEIM